MTPRCSASCLRGSATATRLPTNGMASESSVMQARIFVAEGVDKIRLTGGEPTLRKDLEGIARELGSLPGLKTLAMTSNGVALRRKLHALADAGMSALNISLDTLLEDRFEGLTRRKGAGKVMECVEEALERGFAVKVNVVVMRGINDDEICDFVELTRHRHMNVRFIEYMPFDDNAWSKHKMVCPLSRPPLRPPPVTGDCPPSPGSSQSHQGNVFPVSAAHSSRGPDLVTVTAALHAQPACFVLWPQPLLPYHAHVPALPPQPFPSGRLPPASLTATDMMICRPCPACMANMRGTLLLRSLQCGSSSRVSRHHACGACMRTTGG